MDNLYYARLSREPVEKSRPPAVPQDLADHTFRILPIPASQPGNPASMDGKPIELHVPAIHIHHDQTPTPDDHAPTGPALSSEGPAVQVQQGGFWSRVGVKKPHPFLWISLLLSLIALVLEVPKGSLPTLTGRHKALRTQEKAVQEQLALLTQLSAFLPPPLSALLVSGDSASRLNTLQVSDLPKLADSWRFWAAEHGPFSAEKGAETWWSVEELGERASVVRSQRDGAEREVWSLRMGESNDKDTTPLVKALTHSLLLRDRLQAELSECRVKPCPECRSLASMPQTIDAPRLTSTGDTEDEAERRERGRSAVQRQADEERRKALDERERDVTRREQWVVEEIRRMSERLHDQATELTLEDRITERLKAYQRQLAETRRDVHSGSDDKAT